MQGQDSFGAFLNGEPPAAATLPGIPHSPAGRLNAHAAVLQQPRPWGLQPELPQMSRASPAPDLTNWAADFSRFAAVSNQQQQQQPQNHQVRAAPAAPMQMAQPNFQAAFGQPFIPMYNQGGLAGPSLMAPVAATPLEPDFDQEMARWMARNGGGNMADVDAAMEQMARELELNETALPAASEATEAATAPQSSSHLTDLETPELGNLSMSDIAPAARAEALEPEQQVLPDNQPPAEDASKAKSAVSEAAERLLESVQHEGGEKWQNSVFLSLMRDFRDGRKDIIDNEIKQMGGEEGENQGQGTST